MNQTRPGSSTSGNSPAQQSHFERRLASGLALTNGMVVGVSLFVPIGAFNRSSLPEAFLVLTVTLATIFSLAGRLPLQNVALAGAVIAFVGGTVHAFGAATGLPFGPFSYFDEVGPRLFNTLAWPIPFLWIIAILNSRGVARLILRPWRKMRNYGFWLMGVTAALVVIFDLALEPFATSVKAWWIWQPTRLPLTWGGAPVSNFLGWFVTALLILAFITPSLIDKRHEHSSRLPRDYHPLIVWSLLMVLFAAGHSSQHLWLQAMVTGCLLCLVTIFAIRGARW